MKKLVKNLRKQTEDFPEYVQEKDWGYEFQVSTDEDRKLVKKLAGLFQFDPQTASIFHDLNAFGGKVWLGVEPENRRVNLLIDMKEHPEFKRTFE